MLYNSYIFRHGSIQIFHSLYYIHFLPSTKNRYHLNIHTLLHTRDISHLKFSKLFLTIHFLSSTTRQIQSKIIYNIHYRHTLSFSRDRSHPNFSIFYITYPWSSSKDKSHLKLLCSTLHALLGLLQKLNLIHECFTYNPQNNQITPILEITLRSELLTSGLVSNTELPLQSIYQISPNIFLQTNVMKGINKIAKFYLWQSDFLSSEKFTNISFNNILQN